MKFGFRVAAMLAAAVLTFSISGESMAAQEKAPEQQFITIGTGGITGVYYPVGGAICRLVNQGRKSHGVRCTVESTGASVFNANAVRSGDLSLGVVQSDVQFYAVKGVDKFKEAGPDDTMRALFSLHSEPFSVVARDDAGIKTFEELAGKRVNIGDPGSGNRATMELLMDAYAWTPATFKLATDLKPAEMAGALCDNKIDAYIYVIGHPNASIKEASTTCKSHLVPVEGPIVEKFIKDNPFYPVAVIPGGMYTGTPDDVTTFGPKATIVASSKLSEEAAYLVVKAIFDNLDDFKKLHPALADLTPEEMLTGNTAPFHSGAIKYYKEKGLMK